MQGGEGVRVQGREKEESYTVWSECVEYSTVTYSMHAPGSNRCQ